MSEATGSARDGVAVPTLARLWQRLPVVIRAVLVGAIVNLIGQAGSSSAMVVNLKVFPRFPWSLPVAAIWLGIFWSYVNGSGWPRATSARRRELLRASPLSAPVWGWALLTCGLLLGCTIAFHFTYSRFQPTSMTLPEALLAFPPVTLVGVLLLASAQAGIVEEAAFRGYMFTPIERRHGPVVATVVVSLVFLLAHLNNPQNLDAFRIASILFAGVVYCVLVVVTGSILPGLIAHAVGDAIGLLLLWRAAARPGPPPARLVGAVEALRDPTFLASVVAVLACGLAAVWAFAHLLRKGYTGTPESAVPPGEARR
jgi:membrane protease YdiL (CAAX protease family)